MNVNPEPNKALVPVIGSRRGKPGRPCKGDLGIMGPAKDGHSSGTDHQKTQSRSGVQPSASVQFTVVPIGPRLLDLHSSAVYLGLSKWTIRDLEAAGLLPRVRIPGPNHKDLNRLLFDKTDLDRLIDSWKAT